MREIENNEKKLCHLTFDSYEKELMRAQLHGGAKKQSHVSVKVFTSYHIFFPFPKHTNFLIRMQKKKKIFFFLEIIEKR